MWILSKEIKEDFQIQLMMLMLIDYFINQTKNTLLEVCTIEVDKPLLILTKDS